MRFTHEAQVIPSTGNETISMGCIGVVLVLCLILLGGIVDEAAQRVYRAKSVPLAEVRTLTPCVGYGDVQKRPGP